MNNNRLFSIANAANILGVSTKTLRRWDQQGRFVATRTAGNQRRYTQAQIDKLRFSRKNTASAFNPPPLFSENEAPKELKVTHSLPSILSGLPSGSFLKSHFLARGPVATGTEVAHENFLGRSSQVNSSQGAQLRYSENFVGSPRQGVNPLKMGFVFASLVLILSLVGAFVLTKYNVAESLPRLTEVLSGTKDQFAKFMANLSQISLQIKNKDLLARRSLDEGGSFVLPDLVGGVLAAATGGSDLALNINVPAFFSQTVGIGIATQEPSAILNVASEDRGFLAPRMTTEQRDAIASPATSLFVYNTDTNHYNMYNGTSWQGVFSSIGDSTTGEAFTETGTSGTSLFFYDADGRGKLTTANLTGTRTYTLPDASGEVSLLGQTISNSELVNSKVTVSAGTNMTGGGEVALGSSITLTLKDSISLAGTTTLNGIANIGDGGDNVVINSDVWDITGPGVASGLTGLSSSGTITFSGLTASRALFTDASSNLAATAVSSALLNALTDETGTGVAVFGTSPAITTSLTTPSTTFALVNDTATTVNFAQAATTLTMGATTGTATIRNATVDFSGGSATVSGNLTLYGAARTIQTTALNTLTIGGTTTGFIVIDSGSSAITLSDDVTASGDIAVNGGDITTTATTFALVNTTATTVNFAGAGTTISIGASTGTTTINNATAAVTGNLTIAGTTGITASGVGGGITFSGTGNHDITASAGTLRLGVVTITGTQTLATGVDILAAGAGSDLGSSTTRLSTVWADTVNATNLAGTVTGGATTSSDWLINSDNATGDTENASLTFERGTPATNVQILWNSTTKQLSTNSPSFAILPDSAIAFSGTSALIVDQIQSQDIFTASASGTTRFTVANSGNTTIVGDLAVNGATSADITSTTTTGTLFDTTVTTLSLGGAATTLNLGTTDSVTRTINLGTGTGADTINIGTGATTANTVNVGTGAVANTIAIGSSSTTGLSLTDDNWSVSVGGVTLMSLGAVGAPSYSFTGDTNNGIWSSAADTLNFSTAGSERVRIDSGGNVGIGNTAPLTALDVTGSASLSANLSLRGSGTAHTFNILDNGSLNFRKSIGGDAGVSNVLYLENSGNVGIGNTAPATTLDITGTLRASSTVTFTGLTASRALFTDASSNLAATAVSSALLNALTDETGTGVAVFGTSPAITTSLTTPSTTFALVNDTATTVNFAQAATTLTMGATTGTATIRNATVDFSGGSATVSGNLTLYGAARTIQTTALNTLTIGGTTTGFIVIDSGSSVVNVPDLTASRVVFTDASSNLAATGLSVALLNTLTDETGTGVAVFGTAPTFTTSITDPLVIGGTGTTSTLTLRSTSGVGAAGADIIFQTGNNGATEAVRILNSGFVGIANTTPLTALDVTGSASLSANLSLRGSGTAHTFNILDNGSLNFRRSIGGDGTVSSTMYLQNNGNVGIGNTAPGALLDIGLAGTTLGVVRFAGSTSGNVTVQPAAAAGTWTMTLPTSGGTADYFLQTNGSGVTTWAAAGGGGWTDDGTVVRLTTITDLVGIGNTAPLTALDVTGSASLSANLSLRGSGTAHTFNILDNGSLNFQKSIGGDAGVATVMYLQNSGNVGIGTTAPGALLELGASGSPLIFEGATANDFETTLSITDPTADRTITIPNRGGTVSLVLFTRFTSSNTWTKAAGVTAVYVEAFGGGGGGGGGEDDTVANAVSVGGGGGGGGGRTYKAFSAAAVGATESVAIGAGGTGGAAGANGAGGAGLAGGSTTFGSLLTAYGGGGGAQGVTTGTQRGGGGGAGYGAPGSAGSTDSGGSGGGPGGGAAGTNASGFGGGGGGTTTTGGSSTYGGGGGGNSLSSGAIGSAGGSSLYGGGGGGGGGGVQTGDNRSLGSDGGAANSITAGGGGAGGASTGAAGVAGTQTGEYAGTGGGGGAGAGTTGSAGGAGGAGGTPSGGGGGGGGHTDATGDGGIGGVGGNGELRVWEW